MQKIAFIGVALGLGAQKIETELGPELVKSSEYIHELICSDHLSYWQSMIYPEVSEDKTDLNYEQRLEIIAKTAFDLAQETAQAIEEDCFPIVVGGDHSIAIGTWSGIVGVLKAKRAFGLIWFDAHMDAHTPKTTPSMAIHGMPVAILLGKGEASLVNIYEAGQKIDPRHLVLMGTRSFEEEEAQLLKHLGVKIFSSQEIMERGFKVVCQEALEIVNKGTKGFGLSIDLDGFDPNYAPGTGSHAPHGLNPDAILEGLSTLMNNPNCKGLEIAEFNPVLDENNKTLNLIEQIIRQKVK